MICIGYNILWENVYYMLNVLSITASGELGRLLCSRDLKTAVPGVLGNVLKRKHHTTTVDYQQQFDLKKPMCVPSSFINIIIWCTLVFTINMCIISQIVHISLTFRTTSSRHQQSPLCSFHRGHERAPSDSERPLIDPWSEDGGGFS